jgi:myo-inositol-1(or 4)-monophosphatase
MIQDNNDLAIAIKAAKRAGHVLQENFGKKHRAVRKSPKELVSEIDLKAQNAIIEVLKEGNTRYGLITEERTNADIEKKRNWIIDPLDGTHNYVAGLPFSGISIGLAEKDDFLLGVIYFPMEDQLYYAVKGKGAFLNDRPISVSGVTKLANSIVNFDNQFHLSQNSFEYFEVLAQKAFTVRIFGTATMDSCLVSSGKIEGRIWLNAKICDIAAGLVIITEAGGQITDYQGKTCDLDSRQIIASNGKIHGELLEIFQRKAK